MNNAEVPFKNLSTCWKDAAVIGTEAERSGGPLDIGICFGSSPSVYEMLWETWV